MSSTKPSNDPKTVTVSAEPVKPKTAAEIEHERMLKLTSELPADAAVFVLLPWEQNERHAVVSQLDDKFNKYFEEAPKAHHELKAARLPLTAVVFVAHRVVARARRDDGTFGPVNKLHIGGPVRIKDFTAESADGYTWNTDLGGIVDAVTKACRHENGVVWLGQLSGDPKPDQKVLKLSAC